MDSMWQQLEHAIQRAVADHDAALQVGHTSFGVIGGGFRTEIFLHVAKALPQQFSVAGMVVRDAEKGRALEQKWGVRTYRTLDQLLQSENPEFMVVSVPPDVCKEYLVELARRDIPALAETPPAKDLDGLRELDRLRRQGAKIQVAEQYYLRPMHAARITLAQSGVIGDVAEASVSISHGYHGVSLLRKLLGIGFAPVRIRAMRFAAPVIAGPTRAGLPTEESIRKPNRDIAWLDFGDKLGVYDFTQDQHRSWIRSTHLSARGKRGEFFDHHVNVLARYDTPLHLELRRVNRGEEENVEGYFLSGVTLGNHYVYRNPFAPARFNDDEIAVATCMMKMARYVQGGPSFYDLREASQDHYLGMLIEQAITTGENVCSAPQPWMDSV